MRITIHDGLTGGLTDRLNEYNGGVDKYEAATSKVTAARDAILIDVETASMSELRQRLNDIEQNCQNANC